jgi:cell division inhibitor SulA
MPKYMIERELPGIGHAPKEAYQEGARASCVVLKEIGPEIQWVQSYVTGDKLYCVYIAPNEELIREHARRAGIPANKISEVKAIIDPSIAG